MYTDVLAYVLFVLLQQILQLHVLLLDASQIDYMLHDVFDDCY